MSEPKLDKNTLKNRDLWLEGAYDKETKAAIKAMSKSEVEDAFHTHLKFGTGGMRGIMGVGTNRINTYTIASATQGLASYILKQPRPNNGYSAIIGYDTRRHSHEFAQTAAQVLAGNGIHAYLFRTISPTPLVSFGCRYKKCISAIMITASHNPPEYNGYKVYWASGAQVLPPHDEAIIEEVKSIKDPTQVKSVESIDHPLITFVGDEIEKAYLDAINTLQSYPDENRSHGGKLKIIYTSLHGTGSTLVPKALQRWGFTNVSFVDSQMIPDGNFPTCTSPNPEDRKALSLGIQEMEKQHADLLVATDPDADRMGVAVNHKGKTVLLNGNQVASLFLHHVCTALTDQGRMPENAAFVKTIATTELFRKIAVSFSKPCFDVLPGFKYIAQLMEQWEKDKTYQFVFGGEESYGYLLGTNSFDKDGVLCTALVCEAALHAKTQGKTLVDLLYELFQEYGVYVEKLVSLEFKEGKAGKDQMKKAVERIEQNPPILIGASKVVCIENYKISVKKNLVTGKQEPLALPKTSAFIFWLEDGSKLLVRPSGTEPKIKIYCGVHQKEFEDAQKAMISCETKADALIEDFKKILN